MKKVTFIILCLILLTPITGCNKKEPEKLIDINLKVGTITTECINTIKNDNYTLTETVIKNYDENQDIMNSRTRSEYIFTDLKQFEQFDKENKEAKLGNEDNIIYKYVKNEDKQTITIVIAYPLLNEELSLKEYIESSENNEYKCKITGITREEIGLTDE